MKKEFPFTSNMNNFSNYWMIQAHDAPHQIIDLRTMRFINRMNIRIVNVTDSRCACERVCLCAQMFISGKNCRTNEDWTIKNKKKKTRNSILFYSLLASHLCVCSTEFRSICLIWKLPKNRYRCALIFDLVYPLENDGFFLIQPDVLGNWVASTKCFSSFWCDTKLRQAFIVFQ